MAEGVNVRFAGELQRFIKSRVVKSGLYNSASEVVREALRLLDEHDRARRVQLAAFNQELGTRLAALDRGEHVSSEAVRTSLGRKSRRRG